MESRKSPSEASAAQFDRPILPDGSLATKPVKNKKQRSFASDEGLNAVQPDQSLFGVPKTETLPNTKEYEKTFWENEPKTFDSLETDDTTPTLTPEQSKRVVEDFAEARTETINQEISDVAEDSPAAAVAHADKTLLENIRNRLRQTEATAADAEVVLVQATQETAIDLRLGVGDEDTPDAIDRAAESEPADSIVSDEEMAELREAAINALLAEDAAVVPAESKDVDVANTAGVVPPPPTPPTTEGGALSPEPDQPSPSVVGPEDMAVSLALAQNERSAPSVANAAHTPEESPIIVNRRQGDVAAGVLMGGVAGYMIGRRSGRKKTEARLKPSLEKQQKEITALQQKIVDKEQYIRGLAAKKVAAQTAETVQQTTERRMPDATPRDTSVAEARTPITSSMATRQIVPRKETARSPIVAHQKAVAKRVVAESKQTIVKQIEKVSSKVPITEQPDLPSVEQMSFGDVLSEAKQVTIGHRSLESYYITGRLSEQGVRKILTELRQGRRPERILQAELRTAERLRNQSLEKRRQAISQPVINAVSSPTQAPSSLDPSSLTINDPSSPRVMPSGARRNTAHTVAVLIAVGIAIVLLFVVLGK